MGNPHNEDQQLNHAFMGITVRALQAILNKLEKLMASLDETLAAVNAESTVDDSIIALLQGLAAQIGNSGLSAADQAKVDQIFAQAQANAAKVSAAVTANTPAAP